MQLEDWLDDLCVRFIVNIPSEELSSIERICFQIEEAQWFYEDFIRPLDPSLPSLSLKPFFLRITQRCPLFRDWPQEQMGAAFEQFLKYKNRVPVRGAIMLTDKMDEVLLVKGWKKNGTWSFPRGKINKDESDIDCAVREAWEETGFDLRTAGLVDDKRKPYPIDQTIRSQSIRLFVFRGVPRDALFVPQTRKEISKIEWYKLSDLPTLKKKQSHQEGTINANKYYMVAPFMQQLKKFIAIERKKDKRHSSNLAAPPMIMGPAIVDQDIQHVIPLQHAIGPLSPPIPSSLPEVDPTAMHDPAVLLKQQLNITPIVQHPPAGRVDPAKSNALLALLRSGPAVEMRNDPHTPSDQTEFATQPRMPQQPTHPTYPIDNHPTYPIENHPTPPVFDMHQQIHPTAPPPSALPQLSQHKLSLLQAFQQSTSSVQATQAMGSLPTAKQDLLATLSLPMVTRSNLPPARSPANDLLALLQHKSNSTDLVVPGALPDILPGTQAPPPTGLAISSPASGTQVSPPPTNPLLQTLLQPTSLQILSQFQEHEVNTDTDVSVTAALPRRTPPLPESKQVEPVELSAVSEQASKSSRADMTKEDLLSLLKEVPRKATKPVDARSRTGSVAATLSGPISEPHFDAIPKVSVLQDDMRRDPISSPRKLFDPKHDDPKRPPNIQVLPRHEDRSRPQKSPRSVRHKQENTQRQPITQKEIAKPFQPQILKRPQTAEGEAPEPPFTLLNRNSVVRDSGLDKPEPSAKIPTNLLSLSSDTPQPVPTQSPSEFFSPTQKMVQTHDPQREALLSLLRAPSQGAGSADVDSTPKASASTPQPPVHRDNGVSPPTPAQMVSPVVDNEFQQNTPRSRVSSLASTGNGLVSAGGNRSHVEKRQTTASDKAFLMSYLKNFATQEAS